MLDQKARLKIYAEDLAKYPADVVRSVLTTCQGVFFPAWAELKDRLDLHASYRAKLLHALENPPKPTPKAPQTDRYISKPKSEIPAEIQAKADRIVKARHEPVTEPEETPEEFEARKRRMIVDFFPG